MIKSGVYFVSFNERLYYYDDETKLGSLFQVRGRCIPTKWSEKSGDIIKINGTFKLPLSFIRGVK